MKKKTAKFEQPAKVSGDRVARIASRILRSNAKGQLCYFDKNELGWYADAFYTAADVRTLAASVLSQSDGPEKRKKVRR